jgi:hypothetical protein
MNKKAAPSETTKDKLIGAMEYMSEEQMDFVLRLTNLGSYPTKVDLLKLSGFDTSKTYDTATPIDYLRRIEEIYPNIKDANLIFDYSKNSWGEMTNVNDMLVREMIYIFKSK